MVRATALIVAALAPTILPGPAILYINGSEMHFVAFSSFERCEEARAQLEKEWAEYRQSMERSGFKQVPGTGNKAKCIPG